MTRSSRAAICAAAFVLAVAPALGAQQVPANMPSAAAQAVASRPVTPFRKGQWGMEFAVDQYAPHLGFVKFRSPTKAWVLDVGASGSLRSAEGTTFGDSTESEVRSVNTSALIGIRSYRALTSRAVRTIQFGVVGRYSYGEGESNGVQEGNGYTVGAGPRFDLGGAYFFTPGFSFGGTLAIGGYWSTYESNNLAGRQRGQTVDVSLAGSRVTASLYF